jgi:hypothetical protein
MIIFVKCKTPSRDAKISFSSSLMGISSGVGGGGEEWVLRPPGIAE